MSLIPIKCRCGKSTTNFQKNIGPWYIDTCCQIAGYDHLGNLKAKEETTPEAPKTEETSEETVTNPEEKAQMETVSETTLVTEAPTTEEVLTTDAKTEKPKRTYNRGGNVKKIE